MPLRRLAGARGASRRAGVPAALLRVGTHVVAVALGPVLGGARRRHGTIAGHAPQEALEQRAELVANRRAPGAAVPLEKRLHPLPDVRVHDGGVFAVVDLGFVLDLANVGDVGEQLVQAGLRKRLTAGQVNQKAR